MIKPLKKVMLVSVITVMFALSPSLGSAYSISIDTPSIPSNDSEWRESFQLSKKNNYIVPNDSIFEEPMIENIQPYSNIPGDGATDLKLTTYGWYGQPITQGSSSGIFDNIKNAVLTIVGVFTTNVQSIIISVFDIALSNVDYQRSAYAETRISYNFPTKQGLVYYNSKWNVHFESVNRATYKHYLGGYTDKNKNYRTKAVDFVVATGHGPVQVEYAPHYTNNSYITQQAYLNYLQSKKYTDEYWYN